MRKREMPDKNGNDIRRFEEIYELSGMTCLVEFIIPCIGVCTWWIGYGTCHNEYCKLTQTRNSVYISVCHDDFPQPFRSLSVLSTTLQLEANTKFIHPSLSLHVRMISWPSIQHSLKINTLLLSGTLSPHISHLSTACYALLCVSSQLIANQWMVYQLPLLLLSDQNWVSAPSLPPNRFATSSQLSMNNLRGEVNSWHMPTTVSEPMIRVSAPNTPLSQSTSFIPTICD